MNSIVFTHFVTPMEGASLLAVALHRFGAWFDSETGSLEDLLDIPGHEDSIDDIEALHDLQLDACAVPGDLARPLKEARPPLARLRERVQAIPLGEPDVRRAVSEFRTWVRWTEARLADILVTLDHVLAP